jgi:hypothetical protein
MAILMIPWLGSMNCIILTYLNDFLSASNTQYLHLEAFILYYIKVVRFSSPVLGFTVCGEDEDCGPDSQIVLLCSSSMK